jgi:ADP-ribosylglycohydrolase
MASSNNKLDIRDKFLGSFLGAVIGDAIGWPQEVNGKNTERHITNKNRNNLKSWTRKNGGSYYTHLEKLQPGEYSDDSQLLIATARSLMYKDNWSKHFGKVELPAWVVYERGGGGATKRAAKSLSEGIPPWKVNKDVKNVQKYFEAGGNGVVMRIMPHVFYSEKYNKDMYHQIMINGIYTHGHPRGLIGALIYAQALKYLINLETTLEYGALVDYLLDTVNEWGDFPKFRNYSEWLNSAEIVLKENYLDLWARAVNELIEGLTIVKEGLNQGVLDDQEDILFRLGCFNPKTLGAGTVGALVSIFLASKYASNPNLGLLEAAFLKNTDTDTIASLVGGLLGALHGSEWIKIEWNIVQDREYIYRLVDELLDLESMNKEANEFRLWSYQDNEAFKKKLKTLELNSKIALGPFDLTLVENIQLQSLVKNMDVISSRLRSNEGQQIFVKNYFKNSYKAQIKSETEATKQTQNDKNILKQFSEFNVNTLKYLPPRMSAKKYVNLLAFLIEIVLSNEEIEKIDFSKIRKELSDKNLSEEQIQEISKLIIELKKVDNS